MAEGTTQLNTGARDDRSPDEIRRDIERRRRSMDAKVDELQERLRPGRLLGKTIDRARESGTARGSDAASTALHLAKRHPIPLAIIGAGVAALLLENATHSLLDLEERDRDVGDPMRSTLPATGAPAPNLAAARARSEAAIADEPDGRVGRARSGLDGAIRDNPWPLGAAALGVGLAIGLALPRTETEDGLLGPTSDVLAEGARRASREALAKGRVVARAAGSAATARAREVGAERGVGEAVRNVVREAERAAEAKARQVDLTPERAETIGREAAAEADRRRAEETSV